MKHIIGVVLLILTGMILTLIWSCLKEAIFDGKTSSNKHKLLLTIICFLGDAWDLIVLAFLSLMFGLICLL